ncbi:hypothetical protein C825_002064 [Parabacteroides sp. ASF519]|nr:hypothetical protein C825_002064 [Parabacteroides sp. ASF519]
MNSMSDNGVMKGKWTEFVKNSGIRGAIEIMELSINRKINCCNKPVTAST